MRHSVIILAFGLMLAVASAFAVDNMVVNPDFEGPLSQGWNLEVHNSHVAATMALDSNTSIVGKNSARIDIESIVDGAEVWRLQFKQVGLTVVAAQTYTWAFWAKANEPRPANVWVGMEADPWATLGTSEEIALSTDWQEYHFTFDAAQDYANTRLAIQLAGSKVTPVWVDNEMLYAGEYVAVTTPVEPGDKLSTTWARIRAR